MSALKLSPGVGLAILLGSTAAPMWAAELRRNSASRFRDLYLIPSRNEIRLKFENFMAAAIIWLSILCAMQATAAQFISGFFEVLISWFYAMPIFFVAYFFSKTDVGRESIGELFRFLSRRPGSTVPWLAIRVHVIKAFFLPLMAHAAYTWLVRADNAEARGAEPTWFVTWFAVLYLIDTIFGTLGYMTTSKAVGANVRSTETTLLGWVSALMCYAPFHKIVAAAGLTAYQSKYEWHDWLTHGGLVFNVWAVAILFFSTIYAWATIVFGLRFSNLTNRGVITSGPFRYFKHPAYLSKNISWWLISVPFIPALGVKQAIFHCLALIFVNAIYFTRAKTEERHMMRDPVYREYSRWIDENGCFARAAQALNPFYRVPKKPVRES
ncbi:isoprenylcysteine carboxylmethyltransferase family protein [Variovorax sp. J22R203]|uniref:isoprenylcysteine carboxylmethyltransferase family protein n=1 Tax=Variovorax sp. J22R203 TaxID=3053512 RepID=UPI0025779853|nr:isoprenylcysteine carboxylmethyltransferase family protein [Variovorax sp. J22R203]MDM0007207.1 isoprenylcysteine carboxylmethyltransferase family protein [Variovorax sp. J22R203]